MNCDHTPGPWKFYLNPYSDQWTVDSDGRDHSLVVSCGPATNRCSEGNARLIAAAPDLLAACNVARVALEAAVGNAAQLDVAIEAIDAAVVKAVRLAAVLAADRAKN